jgi:hypothetical protein
MRYGCYKQQFCIMPQERRGFNRRERQKASLVCTGLFDEMKLKTGVFWRFASWLATSDELFEEFAYASILTLHEKWYERIFTLEQEHQEGFDRVCQRIVGDLFGMFEASLFAPKTTNRANYFLHVLHYLQGCNDGHKLSERIDEMPLAVLRARGGIVDLVQVLSRMLMGWVTDSMTTLSLQLNGLDGAEAESKGGELGPENEKREVNRFLGWAIWNLRRKLAKRRTRAKTKDWVLAEDVEPLIQHLDGMRCFHHHALIDQEYMQHCYSQADQSRNGGWLSLVSKDYFHFGKVLLEKIRETVQQDHWGRHGNASIQIAAKAICKNAAIKKAFFDSSVDAVIHASALQSLMDRIVLKVFHARAGASMNAWKFKNTARVVKGSSDAAFRADLKSKVSKTTKEVGEFVIRRQGVHLFNETIGDAKKGKGLPKSREDEEEDCNMDT